MAILTSGLVISKAGLLGASIVLLMAPLVFLAYAIMRNPAIAIWLGLAASFLTSGIARYIGGPWGLIIDILLVFTWVALILSKKTHWYRLKNDVFILSGLWFLYLLFEVFNPNSNGLEAWFYAMRGIGFYQFLAIGLVLVIIRTQAQVNIYFHLLIALSLLGTFWGLKQQLGYLDFAENHWLYAENHHEEHILHGVLRVFSFFSDAGQFGASQAMISLLCFILFLSPVSKIEKLYFLAAALISFIGFGISGTRGALAVPFVGGVVYLLINKNFKLIVAGFIAIALVFYILKSTFLFQGVEQVRRMRSALDPENKSLAVRLDNQKTFGKYLRNKPFGAGIGTAGYWGARFNPTSLMANTATDSWYVKIWAETGVVGICLHMAFLGFILGKGKVVIDGIRNVRLKAQAIALYASLAGILFSSYGNQIFGQLPTGIIMSMSIPIIFIASKIDDELKTINS